MAASTAAGSGDILLKRARPVIACKTEVGDSVLKLELEGWLVFELTIGAMAEFGS